jgi:peptidoglycan hydrolase-like protein with peptidoglycan-binding domain
MRRSSRLLALCVVIVTVAPAAHATDLANMGTTEIKALQQRLADGGCYQGAIDGQADGALQAAIKACPSQDPILRIETGMHVAPIPRIGVDRTCRIAVTGSPDKTVRVWSLPDGRLLRTLRVPIGPGDGGKIFAVAISPDGRWIAAGGYDAQWDIKHEMYFYVFDASTGALLTRVGPFKNIFSQLTFHPTAAGWLWPAIAPVSR